MRGLRATRPATGARINTHTSNANRYRQYLTNRQHPVLNRSGIVSRPVYRFTTVLNGVALKMTAQQASKLRGTPGVATVEKNRMFTIKTIEAGTSPTRLLAILAAAELRSPAADARLPRSDRQERRVEQPVRPGLTQAGRHHR